MTIPTAELTLFLTALSIVYGCWYQEIRHAMTCVWDDDASIRQDVNKRERELMEDALKFRIVPLLLIFSCVAIATLQPIVSILVGFFTFFGSGEGLFEAYDSGKMIFCLMYICIVFLVVHLNKQRSELTKRIAFFDSGKGGQYRSQR